MNCPGCRKDGGDVKIELKSYGTPGSLCYNFFKDKQGKDHYHSPNISIRKGRCLNWHSLIVYSSNKCSSCDYGKEAKIEIK
jgi:hypothetical protein